MDDFLKFVVMKNVVIVCFIILTASCQIVKKLDDQVYIQQRSKIDTRKPQIDSLLIVTNGTSAMQRISEDFIALFQDYLNKKGVHSERVFFSYAGNRVNEDNFDNRRYSYTLWIYEQDRKLQLLDNYLHLVPIAIKLTNNTNDENIWIATSIVNSTVRKKWYREKYAGTLILLFKANGLIE